MRFVLLFILFPFTFFGQNGNDSLISQKYFEDQFYLGLSYNFLLNHPVGSNQRNLSYGLQAGVIKDIPLNRLGTKAIGIGAGLALNSYYSNLVANLSNNKITYRIEDNITRSKLETHLLEFPLEFRWRTSTPSEYKFWRVYTGIKLGYLVANSSKYIGDSNTIKRSNIAEFNKLQYGLTVSAGYNTWNVHVYYALNTIFNNDANISNESLNMSAVKIGLMFYLL